MPVLFPKVEKIVCEHLNIPYVPSVNPATTAPMPQSLTYGSSPKPIESKHKTKTSLDGPKKPKKDKKKKHDKKKKKKKRKKKKIKKKKKKKCRKEKGKKS